MPATTAVQGCRYCLRLAGQLAQYCIGKTTSVKYPPPPLHIHTYDHSWWRQSPAFQRTNQHACPDDLPCLLTGPASFMHVHASRPAEMLLSGALRPAVDVYSFGIMSE